LKVVLHEKLKVGSNRSIFVVKIETGPGCFSMALINRVYPFPKEQSGSLLTSWEALDKDAGKDGY